METGLMNKRISIYIEKEKKNSNGELKKMPEFLFACWAGLKELKAEDAESSRKEGVGLSEVKQTITFVIRRELAPRLLGENLNVSYRGTLYTVKACSVKFDELFLNCEVRE